MTRQDHIQWCKERALQEYAFYHPTDEHKAVSEAARSVVSDIRKHPETASLLPVVFMQHTLVKTKTDLDEFLRSLESL